MVTARVTQPVGPAPTPLSTSFGWFSWILTSSEATATVTVGAWADWDAEACKVLWQAVEVPD